MRWWERVGVAEDKAPIRLLIVEDHTIVAEALADVLDRAPELTVMGRTAGIAQTQARLADGACPDVILLDVRLPDGDGAEAAASFRSACPRAAVLILTASDGLDVLARAVRAGAAGFLTKGADLHRLVRAIVEVHAGRVLFDPATLSQVADHLAATTRTTADLTPRELEVLRLMAGGASTTRIAEELVISTHTVRSHVRNLLGKLGAHSKLEGVAIAAREGLIDLGSL